MSNNPTATLTQPTTAEQVDFLPLLGTDFVEMWVGNAKQAAFHYHYCFGFQLKAYSGPETGNRESVAYLLEQGKIRLLLRGGLHPDSPIVRHQAQHGDGVHAIALWVDDATKSFEETTKRGAVAYQAPQRQEDANGHVVTSAIRTYGETIHYFVERGAYNGPFLPGFVAKTWNTGVREAGFKYVDHCVGNVGWGEMNQWVKFYEEVMGFKLLITFDDEDISTEYSALMSKVVSNGTGFVKFPINEPAEGKKKSQIEEYLDFYHGSGVQHIAIATDDIVGTVKDLRSRGVEFLRVPEVYYEDLLDRIGHIDEDMALLKEQNILIDRDDEGYLLQIFTKPIVDRPTLFFEIIQRKGARSFGKGNFKALFEAIEREQDLRGNL